MMLPLDILHEPVWQRLAWTLLHFVWQGLVVAAGVTLLLRLAPWHRAQVRYAVYLAGLLLMAAGPLVTFALLQTPTPAEEPKPPNVAMDVPQPIVVQPSKGESTASPAPPTAAQLPGETTASRQDGGRTTSDIAPPAPRLGTASWKARTDEWARVAQPYGLILWMVGVFLLGMRLLLSFVGVRQLIRNRCPVSAELGRRAVELGNRFGFRSMPPVFICQRIREAIVVGVLRPMVLLPGCWVMEMTPDALEAVIAHELAHIRRWDAWVNLLQRLVETLLFYHPAVWWLSHRLCLEREMCTDELAVKATGQRMTYATTLELLGRKRLNLARPQFGAAMGGGKMALLNRVRNILDISPSHKTARWWPVGLLALLVPLVMLSASTYIARSGPGEARAEGTRQLDAEPDDKDSVVVQTKRGARMERNGPAASLAEMPPRHLAEVTRPGGKDPTAIAWGETEQGLAVGIGEVRTSLKSPIWPIVEAYLENRGTTSQADVPPWQAKFIVELDGRFYAQNDHGGRSSGLGPGARHGPVAIKTQQFHKVARLAVHVAVEQTEPAPVLTEGEHTLRIHYKLVRTRAPGEPKQKLISSPPVTISVSHSPYPEEKAAAMILGELKDSDSDVRRAAVLAAGDLRLAGCRDALVRALNDSDRVTRRYAAEALGEIGDRTAAKPLRDLLDEADMEVRLAAAASLVKLGEDLDVASVEPIIKSKHRVFQNAIWLVRRHGGDQAVPTLIRCLDMEDPSVSSYYNYTLVWQIAACGGPRLRYHHDFDGKGTAKQVEENRMVLDQLQAWHRKRSRDDENAEMPAIVPEPERPSDRKVSLSAKRMPLKDALEELCRAANVSLDLDTDGIQRFGVTINTPVTVDLKDVPLETAVRQVIVSLRAPGVYFAFDNGKLFVSTMDFIQQRLAQKLPDWLRPLYNHGLVARIDDDGQVTEITAGTVVDDGLLAKLGSLPKLRKLYVESSEKITERGLANIGALPALQSLEFFSVTLPEDGLRHLQELGGLRELSLCEMNVSDASLAYLKELRELRVLRLGGNRLTDAGLAHLTGMTHLEVLEIPNTSWVDSRMNITDAGLAHVARFAKLRELDIGRLSITDKGFAHLGGLHDLRRLRLGGTQITGDGLKQLTSFPQLEWLTLGGPSIDDAGMEHVAACGNLKNLCLSYTKIGDNGFQHIGKLGKLERLTLDSHFVTDAGVAHLTSLKNLNHIELRASRVTDKALEHISKITSLTRLDLSGSGYPGVNIGRNFTGTGYAHLAAMPNLRTFWLHNADVRWTELRDLKQLNVMTLSMPTMSEDDVRQLQRALPDTYVSAAWGGGSVPPIQFGDPFDKPKLPEGKPEPDPPRAKGVRDLQQALPNAEILADSGRSVSVPTIPEERAAEPATRLPGKDAETPVASTATIEARGADIGPKFAFSQNGRVELLAFSPDGKTLASVGRHVMFLDAETGKVLHELKLSGYAANSIAYSHDGAVLAAGTSTGQVRLWDTKTFQLKDTFQITRWSVYAVAISPDGGTLASCAADGTVQLWDINAKRHLRTLGEKGDRMGSLAFSPDGRRLAALDRYAHLELWNVDAGELIGTLPREGADFWPRVSFGPDGKTLAVSSAGQVRFWNPDAAAEARMVRLPDAVDEWKKLEQRFPDGLPPDGHGPIFMGMVALADNHKTAASVNLDGTIAVWDVATRKVQYTLTGRRVPDSAGGGIDSLVFSPTGKQVAAGTRDGRVDLWELP